MLIYEPSSGGHRVRFVRLIVEALRRQSRDALLVTAPSQSEVFASEFDTFNLSPRIESSAPERSGSTLLNAAAQRGELLRTINRHRPDRVYLPFGDGVLQALGVAPAVRCQSKPLPPLEAIVFQVAGAYPESHPSRCRTLYRKISWTALTRSWATVLHALDPAIVRHGREYDANSATRWRLLPDPIPPPPVLSSEEARGMLGVDGVGPLIGLAGGIDLRKGADQLLRAFASSALDHEATLVLAGPHSSEIRDQINRQYGGLRSQRRLVSLDRWLTDLEFAAVFIAMDIIAAPYPAHFGSASIVIRAAANATPCLGSDSGWIGRTIAQYGLGWISNVECELALGRSITRAVEEYLNWQPGPAVEELVSFHSDENFIAHLGRSMRLMS